MIHLYIYFYFIYIKLIFKNKKHFFFYNLICAILIFFPFILFNKIYMYINFCYKLIFINKFIKYNQVNDTFYNIKYLNLSLFLNFCSLFSDYC
jgi:hypothetical protein